MTELGKILSRIFRLSHTEITDDLTMAGTDTWDSLSHMELVASIEEHYEINLTADEIIIMVNVLSIKKVLLERGVSL